MRQIRVVAPLRRAPGLALAASVFVLALAACVTTSASPTPTPIPPGDGAPPTAPGAVPGPPSAPPSAPPTAPATPMPSTSPAATDVAPTASPAATRTSAPRATHPPVPASTPASTPGPTPRPTAAVLGTIAGHALSGPTCPVARFPPDPRCADKPVVGLEIVVIDAAGRDVARTRTAIDGAFAVSLPPGTYSVVAQPVGGFMRTPGPMTVTVAAGTTVTVDLTYDTGIR